MKETDRFTRCCGPWPFASSSSLHLSHNRRIFAAAELPPSTILYLSRVPVVRDQKKSAQRSSTTVTGCRGPSPRSIRWKSIPSSAVLGPAVSLQEKRSGRAARKRLSIARSSGCFSSLSWSKPYIRTRCTALRSVLVAEKWRVNSNSSPAARY